MSKWKKKGGGDERWRGGGWKGGACVLFFLARPTCLPRVCPPSSSLPTFFPSLPAFFSFLCRRAEVRRDARVNELN